MNLDEVLQALNHLSPEQRAEVEKLALAGTAARRWVPNPGPQSEAMRSPADEIFYGGQAGGGKTDLEIGLALTEHSRSLILRRTNREALGIVERMAEILGTRDGWSSRDGAWRVGDRTIEVSGCQLEDDKQKFKGQPHDLICVGRGTPVLMADGSFKPVEAVEVGDQVATLEGPQRILRAFRVTDKPAVRMTVGDVTQVQSASHKVLTKSGWTSSDDLSVLRLCSQPTESGAAGISYEQSLGQVRAPLPLPAASSICSRHTVEQSLATSDQRDRRGPAACDQLSAQETGGGSSCASCPDALLLALSSAQQELRSRLQPSADSSRDQHSSARAGVDARVALAPADSQDDCRDVSRSNDGRPQYLQGLQLVATDDRALFQRPADAGQPSPIDCSEGSSGNTPTHTHPIHRYPHPYGKGARLTSADLVASSCSFSPVDVDELFDLEVEDVNHFITAGGIINKNCFDEVSDFSETQYTFICGWNRSTKPGQRCRIVAAGNPPTQPEGLWVLKRWGAWLDPTHPNPAAPGELRWYTTSEDGDEIEVDGPGPHMIGGEPVHARSRTFIPATLADNPDLAHTGYAAALAALPKELRDAYRDGRFDAGLKDRPFQVIPTAWVREAQARWTQQPPEGIPMCAIGVDASGGGDDPMVLAVRYDGWYGKPVVIPGRDIPMDRAGAFSAGMIHAHRRDRAEIVIDMGGGYGAAMYESLVSNGERPNAYKGAEKAMGRDRTNLLSFANKRSSAIWRFREALDPELPGGSVIALPPSPSLVADLTAPTYEVRGRVVHVEPKEDVCKRLGRSTNEGDAVIMAWAYGLKSKNVRGGFETASRGREPQVILRRNPTHRRR